MGLFVTPAVIISKQVLGSVMAVLVTMAVACIVFVCRGYVCTPLCTVRCIENHDGNFVCRLALFAVIAPLTVNIFDYLLAFNQ